MTRNFNNVCETHMQEPQKYRHSYRLLIVQQTNNTIYTILHEYVIYIHIYMCIYIYVHI